MCTPFIRIWLGSCCNIYAAYLFDILFTYTVSIDPDIDGKHVIFFCHKLFLEKMTNWLEIKNIPSQKFIESSSKVQNFVELSFSCQYKL